MKFFKRNKKSTDHRSRSLPKGLQKTYSEKTRKSHKRRGQRFGFLRKKSKSVARNTVRKKSKFKRRLSFLSPLFTFLNIYKNTILSLFLVILVPVFIYVLTHTSFFKVESIRFEGVQNIEQSKLVEIGQKYKGQNIYSIDLDQLEKDVAESSVYIKSALAKKILPDKVVIRVEERLPNLAILNFDGVYLVDDEDYVTRHTISQTIGFTEDEWRVYNTNDLDIKIIEERLVVNLQEEDEEFDKEEFDYSKYDEKAKIAIQGEIRDEMDQTIEAHFNDLEKQVNESEYASLPRVYFYDRGEYEEGEYIESSHLQVVDKVLGYLNSSELYTVTKTIWSTDFTLVVYTLEEKQFVFGINRDIDTQLEDLEIVMNRLDNEGKDFEYIDLRPDTIIVK